MGKLGLILFSFMIAVPVFAQAPAKNARIMVQQEAGSMRATVKENIEAMRETVRGEIEKRKEEFAEMMKEQREKTKKRIEEKQKTLREKLQDIKEDRRKAIVENIDKRLDALNEQKTSHYAKALDQMDAVLGRIEERVQRAEAQEKDSAPAVAAITNAKNKIAAARSAVVVQAGKTYVITITTDAKLKDDVTKAREMLKADLVKVFGSVKDARDAVHAAAVALAQAVKAEKEGTATSTATSTNQ